MVRNKLIPQSSSLQPLPATASITRYSAADIPSEKDSKNADCCGDEPSSPARNLKKRNGASNTKVTRCNINGVSEESKLMNFHCNKISSGASGAIVQLTNINGHHNNKGLVVVSSGDNDDKHCDEMTELKPDHKTENDMFRSRMHASSRNIYRKMFGRYKVGQELLARWSDGLYYLGVICDVSFNLCHYSS